MFRSKKKSEPDDPGQVGYLVTFSISVDELSSDGMRTATNYLMRIEDRPAYKNDELAHQIEMGDEFKKFLVTQALYRLLSRSSFDYHVVIDKGTRDEAVEVATSVRLKMFPNEEGHIFRGFPWSVSVREFEVPRISHHNHGWFHRDPVNYALDNLLPE